MIQRAKFGNGNSTIRRVFAVLVVSWLNLAVLPCAVAFEIDENCPHCPGGEPHEVASHHSDHESRTAPGCVTIQADCCELDDATIETREVKDKNQPDNPIFLSSDLTWRTLDRQVHPVRQLRPPDLYRNQQTLHVLYCVFLD